MKGHGALALAGPDQDPVNALVDEAADRGLSKLLADVATLALLLTTQTDVELPRDLGARDLSGAPKGWTADRLLAAAGALILSGRAEIDKDGALYLSESPAISLGRRCG
jgi:hypothetical protein